MNTRLVFRNRDTSVLNFMGRSISAIFLKVNRSVISAASSSSTSSTVLFTPRYVLSVFGWFRIKMLGTLK